MPMITAQTRLDDGEIHHIGSGHDLPNAPRVES